MDPISDMLTRITNAQAARKEQAAVPFSKVKFQIANLLKSAGYLSDVERVTRKAKTAEIEWLDLKLRYNDQGGAISGVRIISRPSRHLYTKADEIRPVRSGFGTAVISTSQGVMMSKDAKKANLGGEIMFEIW
jgi:small subunit ribosomal protein S8